MSSFVMQVAGGFHRLGIMQNGGQRATFAAKLAVASIAVPENIVVAQVPHHFVPQVAGDGLSALIPENNPSLPVGHTKTGLQRFQNRSINFGIVQSRHARARANSSLSISSAKMRLASNQASRAATRGKTASHNRR